MELSHPADHIATRAFCIAGSPDGVVAPCKAHCAPSDPHCVFAASHCCTLQTAFRPQRSALRVGRTALMHPADRISPPAIRIACSPHRIVAPFRPHFAPSDPHCVFAASRCCPPHTAFPSAIGIPCRATSEVGFSVPSHGEHLFESYVGSTLERTDLDPMDLSEGI